MTSSSPIMASSESAWRRGTSRNATVAAPARRPPRAGSDRALQDKVAVLDRSRIERYGLASRRARPLDLCAAPAAGGHTAAPPDSGRAGGASSRVPKPALELETDRPEDFGCRHVA